MAFNTNAQSSSNDQSQNESWKKAAGFINIYLPQADGSEPKLGAIPMTPGKGADALIEYLASDPANAAKLLSTAKFVYQSATPANKSRFALPV